jgi:ectoine hydroxylase-related dioxygenase (phytanoyl-CoA dioxygenase family)
MPLTDAQVARFKTEGYVAVPDFWDARETAAIQAEIERLKRDGLLYNVATDGDGKTASQTKANLQLCPMHEKSTFVRAMGFVPKVVDSISRLIGDPAMVHLDQVFLKPARHGSGTNWHQDNAYFKIPDPLMGTAMWTAVHAANAANGTMRVIPGSFKEQYEHGRDPDSNHHIRCYPPEERAVTIELPAGGVLFFAYGVAHCTGANDTDNERAGLALHFLRGDAWDDPLPRVHGGRPYITGAFADGGLAAYGETIAGTWDHEVEKVLGE